MVPPSDAVLVGVRMQRLTCFFLLFAPALGITPRHVLLSLQAVLDVVGCLRVVVLAADLVFIVLRQAPHSPTLLDPHLHQVSRNCAFASSRPRSQKNTGAHSRPHAPVGEQATRLLASLEPSIDPN